MKNTLLFIYACTLSQMILGADPVPTFENSSPYVIMQPPGPQGQLNCLIVVGTQVALVPCLLPTGYKIVPVTLEPEAANLNLIQQPNNNNVVQPLVLPPISTITGQNSVASNASAVPADTQGKKRKLEADTQGKKRKLDDEQKPRKRVKNDNSLSESTVFKKMITCAIEKKGAMLTFAENEISNLLLIENIDALMDCIRPIYGVKTFQPSREQLLKTIRGFFSDWHEDEQLQKDFMKTVVEGPNNIYHPGRALFRHILILHAAFNRL